MQILASKLRCKAFESMDKVELSFQPLPRSVIRSSANRQIEELEIWLCANQEFRPTQNGLLRICLDKSQDVAPVV
jgi:hypothetical protein